ncbi:MAG: SU10 major capsid protein, partial [Cetobacterium sp.]
MAILTSYDLQGKKDSFANWISNLSPVDTIFVSTTKKEAVQNTLFQWQTDSLAKADLTNAQVETSAAISKACTPTKVHTNVTQILRKAVEVSDTADSIANWGRSKELAYQMEKAGKEIKRDLEA